MLCIEVKTAACTPASSIRARSPFRRASYSISPKGSGAFSPLWKRYISGRAVITTLLQKKGPGVQDFLDKGPKRATPSPRPYPFLADPAQSGKMLSTTDREFYRHDSQTRPPQPDHRCARP